MGFLAGKRALVVGVASNRSIAWGVAEALHAQGAELALTYQGEKLQERAEKMGAELNAATCLSMDVAEDKDIDRAFDELAGVWDRVDIIVHSVGFAPREQLDGRYIDCVTREGFRIAHDISSYSFPAIAKAARPLLGENASLLTMSYLGAIRAIPKLQRDGPRQGQPRSQRALHGRRSGARRYPGQRHLRRAHENSRIRGHRKFPLHAELCG